MTYLHSEWIAATHSAVAIANAQKNVGNIK